MKIKNFTPCPDALTQEHGLICSAVWGRIWRYAQGQEKKCKASQTRIAEDLGVDRTTVYRYIQLLIEEGYITDLTPNQKYIPHEYRPTSKLKFEVEVSVAENNTGVAENNTGVAENNTGVAENNLKIQERKNKDIKKPSRKRDPLLDHPAIKAYQSAARRNALIQMRPEIADVIGDEPQDVETWKALVADWIGHGWNPGNIKGMLDKFVSEKNTVSEEIPYARDL